MEHYTIFAVTAATVSIITAAVVSAISVSSVSAFDKLLYSVNSVRTWSYYPLAPLPQSVIGS
jgi:hypothetical protein